MLLKVLAKALDQYAFFPITRDQLTMLMQGNTCGGQDAFQSFGLEPVPFDTTRLSYLQGNNRTTGFDYLNYHPWKRNISCIISPELNSTHKLQPCKPLNTA